jgi:hypothetical protein
MKTIGMSRHLGATLLIAVASAGCGAVAPVAWVYAKPGATPAEQQRDERACLTEAAGSADVDVIPTHAETVNREAFNDCMRQRGYEVGLGQSVRQP